jgi:hypothetical protein
VLPEKIESRMDHPGQQPSAKSLEEKSRTILHPENAKTVMGFCIIQNHKSVSPGRIEIFEGSD